MSTNTQALRRSRCLTPVFAAAGASMGYMHYTPTKTLNLL